MKSKLLALVGSTLLLLLSFGCFRQDVRTLVVQIPQMKTADCSKIIQDALGRIEGILSAEPDLAAHAMTVTYDSTKLAIKNVEFLITGLGFDANGNPARPEAKAALPEGCR